MTERVTLADRRAAWPFRPEGYGPADRSDWMAGKFDSNAAIEAFFHHRLDAIADLLAVATAIDTMWTGEDDAGPDDARSGEVRKVWHSLRAAISKARGEAV